MSDKSPKSVSIPAWQRPNKTDESPSPSSDDASATTTTPRQTLLDQASKFLEDESIRDAPTDRKVGFLESKGLSSDDIQQVLGVSRNAEASSTPTEDQPQEETQSTSSTQTEVSPSSPVTSSPSSNTMSQQRPAPASRDVPPIITYPEFLFEQSKPPPLVTMQNLMYTLYGAAGLGASLYGASEYIVKPMLASLTSARHELASTAEENLQKLNTKLEQTVSAIPPQLTARKINSSNEEEDDDSVASDPTELFHRDMATQTSPEPTPAPSTTGAANSADVAITPTTKVNDHVSRVESITSQLRGIIDSEKDASSLDDSMRTGLTELHHYCDTLIYSAPAYSAGSTYGVWNSNTGSNDKSGLRKAEDEAIAGFRADIRGVKGALLSARNFPASRGGRLGGVLPAGRR
jgi:hypothetical protein